MEESLAVAGGLDHRSRGPIDLADRDPGAHDGSRGRLRLLHDGVHLGQRPAGSPTDSVRVVSLQYPSSTPPKSSTTASPGSIVRSVGS